MSDTNTTEDNNKKPTKVQLLKAFKADLDAADTLRLETVANVESWKKAYNGDPYGNEQTGKSALVSRDIKRQDEWQHASVKDPFVADSDIVKAAPVTFEDRAAAEQAQLVLNHQFTMQFSRYRFMTNVVKLLSSEGTVIVKTSWAYEDKEFEEEIPVYMADPLSGQPRQVRTKTVKRLKVLVNKPDAELCRIEDIYMDPTAQGDIDKAQFVIHRYESDLSSLKRAKKYKNLKKVAIGMADKSSSDSRADYDPEDESEFVFQDQARKKLVVYEYWGNYDIEGTGIAVPIQATWVNDTLILLGSNPYPDQKIPFLIVANNSIPFQLYGEANAELIGDNQKISTAIKRGLIDNMANSNNAQKGIRTGALDKLNKKRFLNNKNFEYNGTKEDFFDGNYNQIPQSVFQVLELVNNETESITGVKGFAGGIQGKGLGSTARAAGGVLDAVSVRRLDIVRNIAENLIKPLMRKWMAYNSEFLTPEEVMRITNTQFIQPDLDNVEGTVDIQIEVSTAEDNSSKAQELSFLLQTLGQGMDAAMKNLLMGQIAKLHRMPDLAKQLEEYEPQPDPYVEQMKQLEMRKLESEIEERQSRSRENAVDIRAKMARAILDEARAKQIGADTDMKDLDYIEKANGDDFKKEMAIKDHDRETAAGLKTMDNLTKQ